MVIILVCSRLPRQGKDLCASHIVNNYGFTQKALADPIKEIAHKFYDISNLPKELQRKYFITIGETLRNLDKHVWCRALDKETNTDKLVVSDCRMYHEFEYFKNKYNNVITVGIESNVRGDDSVKDDPTQKDYDRVEKDYIISNNGSIAEFRREINIIMKELGIEIEDHKPHCDEMEQ